MSISLFRGQPSTYPGQGSNSGNPSSRADALPPRPGIVSEAPVGIAAAVWRGMAQMKKVSRNVYTKGICWNILPRRCIDRGYSFLFTIFLYGGCHSSMPVQLFIRIVLEVQCFWTAKHIGDCFGECLVSPFGESSHPLKSGQLFTC